MNNLKQRLENFMKKLSLKKFKIRKCSIIYPSFNENLSLDNCYELRIYNYLTKQDNLYYAKDDFCKEFETLNEAIEYIQNNKLNYIS